MAAIFGRFQDQQSQQGHRQFYRAQARLRRMGKHCYPSGVDSNWVEYAVDELSAAGASRLCVVGCLRRISAATPVFIGRDGSHHNGGHNKMWLRNFEEQAREQGGVALSILLVHFPFCSLTTLLPLARFPFCSLTTTSSKLKA